MEFIKTFLNQNSTEMLFTDIVNWNCHKIYFAYFIYRRYRIDILRCTTCLVNNFYNLILLHGGRRHLRVYDHFFMNLSWGHVGLFLCDCAGSLIVSASITLQNACTHYQNNTQAFRYDVTVIYDGILCFHNYLL